MMSATPSPLWIVECVALGLLVALTVCGNTLVIVAVARSPRLRTPTYLFIVNLAVADLLLGLIVLPISGAKDLFDYQLGPVVCAAWSSMDVLCCTASILSLCALAAERHAGVSRPLRVRRGSRARLTLVALWTVAVAIALAGIRPRSQYQPCAPNKDLPYVIFSACGSFYLPALVMLALWCRVYKATVRRSARLAKGQLVGGSGEAGLRAHRGGAYNVNLSGDTNLELRESSLENTVCLQTHIHHKSVIVVTRNDRSQNLTIHESNFIDEQSTRKCPSKVMNLKQATKVECGQNRAIRTLALVVGGFLLCWCPFFIILPIDAACSTCNVGAAFTFSFWLGYFNSCINPFIYVCSSRDMRRAFRTILCRRRQRHIRIDYR